MFQVNDDDCIFINVQKSESRLVMSDSLRPHRL